MRELDMYRRRFEEAMIRIEDQEDVEAYKEAKAEIDDEFDEENPDGVAQSAKDPAAADKEAVEKQVAAEGDAQMAPAEPATGAKEKLDQKNADGLALQKSEAIDWRNHPTLNLVTKYAIG